MGQTLAEYQAEFRKKMEDKGYSFDDLGGGRYKISNFGKIPKSAEQESAISMLIGLMNKKVKPMKIAGMTDIEKYGQSLLSDYVRDDSMPEAYTAGLNEILATLSGNYDPSQGDYYKGVSSEAERLRQSGISGIRRRSQLGGSLFSTPSARTEAEYSGQIDESLMQELGRLTEAERNKKLNAAGAALSYAGFEQDSDLKKLNAIGTFGSLPRQLEQAKYTAEYNAKTLFPYQYQAPIAQMILQDPAYYYQPESQDEGAGGLFGGLGMFGLGLSSVIKLAMAPSTGGASLAAPI